MSKMMKWILRLSLVALLSLTTPVTAKVKYYQYHGDLPFVEMMLNMMTAMGLLDRIPPGYLSGYPPYVDRFRSPYYGGYPGQLLHPNQRLHEYRDWLNANYSNTINGLWFSDDGEMLGINNRNFIWRNRSDRMLSGSLLIDDQVMLVRINGMNRPIPFQYSIKENILVFRDLNGMARIFHKIRFGDLIR